MKVKCKKCGIVIEIPKGSCPICFSDVLGEINDIDNNDERFEELSDFINELTAYDYLCGEHNAKCDNYISEALGCDWEEVTE